MEVGNGTYDTIQLSSFEEPEGNSDSKYDLSNPTYEESYYPMACPVYEDVVGAVGDYEVAVQSMNRSLTLDDSVVFDDKIYAHSIDLMH